MARLTSGFCRRNSVIHCVSYCVIPPDILCVLYLHFKSQESGRKDEEEGR